MEIIQTKPAVFRVKTKLASVILDKSVVINAKSAPFEIVEPGEYEVEGVSVFGFGTSVDGTLTQTVYLVVTEGLRLLYMPALSSALAEGQIEEFGQVDVLVVGITDAKLVGAMIEKIEPTYILPYEVNTPVASFVTSYEHGSREAASLSVSVATLPVDSTEVVLLSTS